ncbi:MAG: sensor histidine kinase [Pseudomonadales bacterium]|jgi:sensor histidine kinase YesM|nr:sensor histidine kinase [Pseudomonadales bacterium]MDP6470176.1 sensor histidine kinase [Pseudomonadales bacterium]MDP6827082.1 sensor histidine kinase [Pseudomonadales bacterium]MDP6972760.1 sensor histidine kinase [Pseudomonadales bacterium]|tara:strand:- start:2569 stop:3624 length:1056 start_codon:yes stop_codon:yes gene_type:complete
MKSALHSYGWTTLLSAAIALLLWSLGETGPFLRTLLVSCSIGYGINTAFVLLPPLAEGRMSPYLAPIPITAVGLAVGLAVGGWFAAQNPWYFFSEDWGTLIVGGFFGIVGFLIFGTRARLVELRAQLAEAEADRQAQQREMLETQLRLLQAQIEPHFLFNTLSNIAGMIHAQPDEAERTLVDVTTLLRSSLRRTRQAVTTLGEELDIIRAYLDIQQLRMKERLRYEIDVEESLRSTPLPPMLVQPIVENAVRHGIDPLEEGGCVHIHAHARNGGLLIDITDDGKGIHSNQAGTGTGLRNIRERLMRLYNGYATFRLSDHEPSGVRVELFIPDGENDPVADSSRPDNVPVQV